MNVNPEGIVVIPNGSTSPVFNVSPQGSILIAGSFQFSSSTTSNVSIRMGESMAPFHIIVPGNGDQGSNARGVTIANLGHTHYVQIAESEDAVIGLASADEGDHSGGLDLMEVEGGILANKWFVGRGNTSGDWAGSIIWSYGTTADYGTNTHYFTFSTAGKMGINLNNALAGAQLHVLEASNGGAVMIADHQFDDSVAAFTLYRKARGTKTVPTAVQANDDLGAIIARGYHSGDAYGTSNVAAIKMTAAENFTSTNQGTYITFGTTPTGSTTRATRWTVGSDGLLSSTSTRFSTAMGADIASANTLTLGSDGNVFNITGTTQINLITSTGWQVGSTVWLRCTGVLTLAHNQATTPTTAPLLFSSTGNFLTRAGGSVLCFIAVSTGLSTVAWAHAGPA